MPARAVLLAREAFAALLFGQCPGSREKKRERERSIVGVDRYHLGTDATCVFLPARALRCNLQMGSPIKSVSPLRSRRGIWNCSRGELNDDGRFQQVPRDRRMRRRRLSLRRRGTTRRRESASSGELISTLPYLIYTRFFTRDKRIVPPEHRAPPCLGGGLAYFAERQPGRVYPDETQRYLMITSHRERSS